jgi:hypothetical protein
MFRSPTAALPACAASLAIAGKRGAAGGERPARCRSLAHDSPPTATRPIVLTTDPERAAMMPLALKLEFQRSRRLMRSARVCGG